MKFLLLLLLLAGSPVLPSRAVTLGQHGTVQQDQLQGLGSHYGLDKDRFRVSDEKLEHLLPATTSTASQDLPEQRPGLGRMLPGGGKGKHLLSLASRSAQLALKHSQYQQEPSTGPTTHLKLLGDSLEVRLHGVESASSHFKESTVEVAKANQKLATAEQPSPVDDPCADDSRNLPAGRLPSTAVAKAHTTPSAESGRQGTSRWQLGARRLLPGGNRGKHLLMASSVAASGGELSCLKPAQQGARPAVFKGYKQGVPKVPTAGAAEDAVAAGRMLPGGAHVRVGGGIEGPGLSGQAVQRLQALTLTLTQARLASTVTLKAHCTQ